MAEQKAKQAPKPASKPIHSTASPYLRPAVEKTRQPHHDIIADRLISLLAPIGQYRADRASSKGKRGGKRKRHAASLSKSGEATQPQPHQDAEAKAKPASSRPPIMNHILLGFNNVTHHLESLSSLSAPPPPPPLHNPSTTLSTPNPKLVTSIFLLRPLDNLLYTYLPTLSHAASLAYPDKPATRLVLLDPSVEEKIVGAAGVGRVSVMALLEGGGAEGGMEGLVEYVRAHVEPVEVGWLRDVREGTWMGTRVETR